MPDIDSGYLKQQSAWISWNKALTRGNTMTTAIFDFDGTIVDSREAIVGIMQQMSQEFRFREVSRQEMLELRELPVRQRLRRLGIRSWQIPRLAKRSLELFSDHMTSFPIYEGIREMLSELHHANIETQILSSNNIENIKRCLEANQLNHFSHIYSARGLFSKHRMLKRILRSHRIHPANAVYIGDELRDIEAARRAGMSSVAVSWGYDSPDLLQSGAPDLVANEPCEILQFIRENCSAYSEGPAAEFTSLRAADRDIAPK